MVYSNFGRITDRFRDTSRFNAENHILPIPLVFDHEYEGHAVGIWRQVRRQKTGIKGCHRTKNPDRKSNDVGTVHGCDGRTDGRTE